MDQGVCEEAGELAVPERHVLAARVDGVDHLRRAVGGKGGGGWGDDAAAGREGMTGEWRWRSWGERGGLRSSRDEGRGAGGGAPRGFGEGAAARC